MADYAIVRHPDVYAFAERASDWLLQAEVEHNLLLSIIEQLKANSHYTAAPYLVTVEQGSDIVGCAFRTPPYKLGITAMPADAPAMLASDVAQIYDELPAVLGPEPSARAFAEAWGRLRGVEATAGMRHRIYELQHVTFPAELPAGEMRLAARRDLPLIVGWLQDFGRETGVTTVNTATFVENHINHKTLFVWEADGDVRTTAAHAGKTPHGVRIGFVYTPPQFRKRGYASACVANASQRALDAGARFCCLYTDLSNPTSNEIYQQIGYQPVCDVMDYEFAQI